MPLTGSTISHYRLGSQLGSGGMGRRVSGKPFIVRAGVAAEHDRIREHPRFNSLLTRLGLPNIALHLPR